ncbi:MAG: transposase [Rhizobacter sp.]|nr:transposase [Rhizobacter sp.]
MARYGKAFKDRAVARLLPPESAAVEVVSREIGVSASTLERWRSEAQASGRSSGGWTAAARLEALLTTAVMSEAEKGAWCRSKGLFPSELDEWRVAAQAALESPSSPLVSGNAAERRRVKELERQLRRKDRALAETAALLVLSKKLEGLFPKDADE